MVWVRIEDTFPRGRKVKRAARLLEKAKGVRGGHPRGRVIAVMTDMLAYCNAHLTDGFVPDDEVEELPDYRPLDVLHAMSQGSDDLGPMVTHHDDRHAWEIRNYADYQPTKASTEQRRNADRLRKQAEREGVRTDKPAPVPRDTRPTQHKGPSLSLSPDPARPGPEDQNPMQEQAGRPAATLQHGMKADGDALLRRIEAEDNPAVLGRLAHEVLRDVDAGVIDPGDVSEATKSLAAQHGIAYGGDRTRKALDSAQVRRTRENPSDAALRIAEVIVRQAPGMQIDVKAFQGEAHRHAHREWPDEEQSGFRGEVIQILWRVEWYRLDQTCFQAIGTMTDPNTGRALLKPAVGAYRWIGTK